MAVQTQLGCCLQLCFHLPLPVPIPHSNNLSKCCQPFCCWEFIIHHLPAVSLCVCVTCLWPENTQTKKRWRKWKMWISACIKFRQACLCNTCCMIMKSRSDFSFYWICTVSVSGRNDIWETDYFGSLDFPKEHTHCFLTELVVWSVVDKAWASLCAWLLNCYFWLVYKMYQGRWLNQ